MARFVPAGPRPSAAPIVGDRATWAMLPWAATRASPRVLLHPTGLRHAPRLPAERGIHWDRSGGSRRRAPDWSRLVPIVHPGVLSACHVSGRPRTRMLCLGNVSACIPRVLVAYGGRERAWVRPDLCMLALWRSPHWRFSQGRVYACNFSPRRRTDLLLRLDASRTTPVVHAEPQVHRARIGGVTCVKAVFGRDRVHSRQKSVRRTTRPPPPVRVRR